MRHALKILIELIAIVTSISFSAQAGECREESIVSRILGTRQKYYVVLPANFEQKKAAGIRFPVVYLLHWFGDGADSWFRSWGPSPRADSAIDYAEMLLVAPEDSTGAGWWLDSPLPGGQQLLTYVARELKAHIDSLYPTIPDRAATGVCGASMGGYGTFNALRYHSSVFSVGYAVVACTDIVKWGNEYGQKYVLGDLETAGENWRAADLFANARDFIGLPIRLRFYTGDNDFFLDDNIAFHSRLDSLGVQHDFDVIPGIDHSLPSPERMVEIVKYFDTTLAHSTKIITPQARRPSRSNRIGAARTPSNPMLQNVSLQGRRLSHPAQNGILRTTGLGTSPVRTSGNGN